MPTAIWALAASVFAIGTTEVVMIGLLSSIAEDLSTSIASTGWLVTSYAVGVAVGGPLVAALTNRMHRKKLLFAIMLLFVAGNGLAALATTFGLLLFCRVVSGVAHGVFVGIGANVASGMVSREKRATAISIVFTGLTVAMVTGVPLGTYIGQRVGWRFTFGSIAIVGLFCLVANQRWLPTYIKRGRAIEFTDQLRVLRHKSMMLAFALTALSFTALFGTFTYLSPLLEMQAGFTEDQITLILLLYGVAVALGNLMGGKLANYQPARVIANLLALLVVTFCLMFLLLPYKIPALAVVAGMGFLGFAIVPGIQLYVIELSEKYLPGTEDVASVLNISAFNVGIAAGSIGGGILISTSPGIASITMMSALFSAVAFGVAVMSRKQENKFTKII